MHRTWLSSGLCYSGGGNGNCCVCVHNSDSRAGYAGVGLNPARCLGPALLHGGPLWKGHWVFWVGPFVACVVYYGFTKTLPEESLMWEDTLEYDIINLATRVWRNGTGTSRHLQRKK